MTDINKFPPDIYGPFVKPEIITAENFGDDTIVWQLQSRFTESSVVRNFQIPGIASRDFSNAVIVNIDATGSLFYTASMVSDVYNAQNVSRSVDTTFTELI